jgi:hypothetical protein
MGVDQEMRCYTCKTGKLTVSGCHEYCDNCGFSRFVVTDNYIDSCIVVLSQLVSNTKFNSKQYLKNFMEQAIKTHLPKLNEFIGNLTGDIAPFVNQLVESTTVQAINLQVDEEVHNEVEQGRDLQCQCGNNSEWTYGPKFPSQLFCDECGAEYVINQELGIYEPHFLCGCGGASFELVDIISGLGICRTCGKWHTHDGVRDIYKEVE